MYSLNDVSRGAYERSQSLTRCDAWYDLGFHHRRRGVMPSHVLSRQNSGRLTRSTCVCRSSSVVSEEGSSWGNVTASGGRLPIPNDQLPLRWGIGQQQGPREYMEDAIQVVEEGPCGFMFASKFILLQCLFEFLGIQYQLCHWLLDRLIRWYAVIIF